MAKNKEEIVRSGGNGRRSAGLVHRGILYTSGITSVELREDVRGQARLVFDQLDKLMAYHNTDKRFILTATVYLEDMDDYAAFNAAWDEWIVGGAEPVRTVVGAKLSLPEYRVKVALTVAVP